MWCDVGSRCTHLRELAPTRLDAADEHVRWKNPQLHFNYTYDQTCESEQILVELRHDPKAKTWSRGLHSKVAWQVATA